MKNYISNLRRDYASQLSEAAFGYLHNGLSMFYDIINHDEPINYQVALGNIAIGVELLLKAFIANKNLLLLFKELSLQTRTMLLLSKDLPPNFNWRAHDLELKSASHKMLDFGECETIFFTFFPDLKQPLKTHLDSLISARNLSIHSILPSYQNYELKRAAYVALKILEALNKVSALPYLYERNDENDQNFLKSFQETKLKQVQEKLEKAKEIAKKLSSVDEKDIPVEFLDSQEPFAHWWHLIIQCPICRNNSMLIGYTDIIKVPATSDGPEETLLGFFPDRFKCPSCKLGINDYDELTSAGFESMYEREENVETFNHEMERLAEIEGWDE